MGFNSGFKGLKVSIAQWMLADVKGRVKAVFPNTSLHTFTTVYVLYWLLFFSFNKHIFGRHGEPNGRI